MKTFQAKVLYNNIIYFIMYSNNYDRIVVVGYTVVNEPFHLTKDLKMIKFYTTSFLIISYEKDIYLIMKTSHS